MQIVRTRTSQRWLLVVSAALLTLGGAVPALAVDADASSKSATAAVSAPTVRERTQAEANTIDAVARARFGDRFGGIVLTEDGTHIVVYLTADEPAVQSELRRQAAPGRVSFEATGATDVAMQALQAEVVEVGSELIRQGIQIDSVWHDPRLGGLRIEVRGLTEEEHRRLVEQFGPDVRPVESTTVPQLAAADRANDIAPWWAGEFISVGGRNCTSGIPVNNVFGNYLLTAAHCFRQNATVRNYAASFAGNPNNNIGTVISQDLVDGRYDAELIAAPGGTGNASWVGPTVTNMAEPFIGSGSTNIGSLVYLSGAFEGEHSFIVDTNSMCQPPHITGLGPSPLSVPGNPPGLARLGNAWACGRVHAHSGDMQSVGQGDSGGPVYGRFGGGLVALGIMSSLDNLPYVACTNWSVQVPGRQCSANMTFTAIAPLLAQWGVDVNT